VAASAGGNARLNVEPETFGAETSDKENNMRVSFAVLTAAVLAVALNFSTPRPAQAACVVDVASWDVLWIRSGPSTRYQKVGSIPHNGCGPVFALIVARGLYRPLFEKCW
jgi:hypothetical protein